MTSTSLSPPQATHFAGRRSRRQNGWSVFALVVASLVAVPIVFVLSGVLRPAGEVWGHLVDTVLWRYIGNTAWLMLWVGLGTALGGVGSAWLVTMCRFPGRRLFEWTLLLPLAMPAYVIAYTYAGMFEFAGPVQTGLRDWFGWSRDDYWFPQVRSLGGAAGMFTFVLYPYVYLLSRAAFLEQSVCVLEIARVLGRGPWRCFAAVALPLARPAIVAGVALALMETLSDYGAVQYFGVDTFTTGIFRTWFGLGAPDAAVQLAAILLVFVFALLFIERWSRGDARFHHTTTRYRPLPRFQLHGLGAGLAFLFCLTPIVLGFGLPGGQLLVWALETAPAMVDLAFVELAWNSVSLAAGAALLAVSVAVLLAYGLRLGSTRLGELATRFAATGYAVPGIVVALGVMLPFAWLDNAVDGWMRARFGVSTGLVLSGTLFALLFAYVVRFLAISFNAVEASLIKVTPNMDSAARTLGLRPAATLKRVHAPIIGSDLEYVRV